MGHVEFERALARRLWEAGVPQGPLQDLLAEVERRPDLSLAPTVIARGLASAELVERSLQGLTGQAPTSEPAPALADYEVTGVLGQGGMGVVHAVRHRMTGAQYALKRTLPAADPQEHERLIREAELLARLDHPGLVRVHSADFSGQAPAFVLEFLSGGSLQHRLRGGPLPLEEARRIVTQIAEATGYLHGEGVLHRDLKPLNVLFDDQGRPRLTDFGLARARGAMTLTQTGELLGTPGYMAPEQILDPRTVDARSDVYALGAILFALLTGRPPFQAATALATLDQVLHQPPPTLESSRGDAEAAAFEEVCARALAKDPEQRPQSAAAFVELLRSGGARASRGPRLAGLVALLALVGVSLFLASQLSPASPASPGTTPATPTPSQSAPPPSPAATTSPRDPESGPVPFDVDALRLLGNRAGGFEELRRILERERELLHELYPNVACAQRDAALIAAIGSGHKLEGWFGGTGMQGTEREQRARRWHRTSSRGDRRALRSYANVAKDEREKRHLLWLCVLSGDEDAWASLVTANEFLEELERAHAQIVLLRALGGKQIERPQAARQRFPSPRAARETLREVLPGLRLGQPLSRAKWGPGRLSPSTFHRRASALVERMTRGGGADWLAASRDRALTATLTGLTAAERKQGKRQALYAAGLRTKNLYFFLASGLRGHSNGLARFVRKAIAQTPIGGAVRERSLQALVLAVVAFDSPASDPAPIDLETADRDRFRSLGAVLRALKLYPEAAALVALQRSLGVPFGPEGLSRAARGLPPLPPTEEIWSILGPLYETCLAVERGEVELEALDPHVPKAR